ncbi:MAG: hypothetical protein E7289_02405 [Lachnospiraceae bacterium]|nr:hypothetical protein [Lachnospiraceae bacterium]
MPWCPVCKNEYVKGYTHCSDCNVELVDSLEEAPKPIIFGEEAAVSQMADFLKANGVEGAFIRYDEKEKAHELYVPKDKIDDAKKMITELLRKRAQEEEALEVEEMDVDDSDVAEGGAKAPDRRKGGSYEDKSAKAEEYKSSAVALIVVGVIGIVALVLFWMGILPFRMYGMGKIMFSGVMGFMFLVFLIMGFNSIKMYKTYVGVASKENTLMDDINAFLEANMLKEQIDTTLHIDASSADDDAAQAQLYFVRIEYIKRQLFEAFPELDMPLADKMADDWYSKQYD